MADFLFTTIRLNTPRLCDSVRAVFGSEADKNALKRLIHTANATVANGIIPGVVTRSVALRDYGMSGMERLRCGWRELATRTHRARAVVGTGRKRCGVDDGSDSVSDSDQMHTAMERR
ncbi:MAG: hypothetical protein PHT14_11350 [Petrimonas sp.]|nr:hypothetical protein [Petrimonas sp.]